MEYFKAMYNSRVVNYDHRGFIGLATETTPVYLERPSTPYPLNIE